MDIVVTETDRQTARDAIVEGYNACEARSDGERRRGCDCDLGAIAGCRSMVNRIALAIATARKI